MDPFRLAAKSFIISDAGKLLIIRRRDNDVHKPGVWEIPGGRLELGEDPYLGLQREAREETGLDIEIVHPLHVDHFTRDDGQKITMLIFLCRPRSERVVLSPEHTAYEWIAPEDAAQRLHPTWLPTISAYRRWTQR